MATREYTFRIEIDDDGGFVAQCNQIPGVITEGDSLEELIQNAKDALELVLESRNARRRRADDVKRRHRVMSMVPSWIGMTVQSSPVVA